MLSGMLLLLEAILCCGIALTISRLVTRYHKEMGALPEGMADFATAMVPGAKSALRFLKLAPLLVRLCFVLAVCLGVPGVYGFLTGASPLWLNLLAILSLLPFAGLAFLLMRLAKKHAPAIQQFLQMRNTMRF